MKRFSAAATALALFTLLGCGNPATAPDAAPTPRATTSTSPAPSLSPSPSPSAAPYRLPKEMRLVTAKKSGLRFAIPKTWSKIDATRLNDPRAKAVMDEFVKGLNLTRKQFSQVLAQIDLMALSAILTPPNYRELQVVPATFLAEIPTRESLKAQSEALHMTPLGFRDVFTPVGKGLVVAIRKVVPGPRTIYAECVYVQLKRGVVGLTVTTDSLKTTRAVLDKMLPTFQDVTDGSLVEKSTTANGWDPPSA